MTAPRPQRSTRLALRHEGDGLFRAVWVEHCYRFLLDDGRTLDVWSFMDSSDLREAVLAYTKAKRIEGVAQIDGAGERRDVLD